MSLASAATASLGVPRRRLGGLWLLAPGGVFLAVFFLLPVARLLLLSLRDPTGGATLAHYGEIVRTPVYLQVLMITFRIAGLTAAISVILGYPVAYWLARQPEKSRAKWLFFVLLPFWTSYLVKTFAWMIILGRNGVINRLLMHASLIDRPLPLLNNELGVMIGMIHAMLPLAVLMMLPIMTGIDSRLTRAAGTLGATPSHAFWLVYVPLSLPGVAAAGLLTFISALGFFIVPALLGGRHETMLSQLIISQVQDMLNWALAGALSALMLASAIAVCWIYDRLFGLSALSDGELRVGRRSGAMRRSGLRALEAAAAASDAVAVLLKTVGGRYATRHLLAVYSILALAFLVLPTIAIVPLGFTSSRSLDFPPPGYGLHWFEVYLNSPLWVSATIRSFGVAFVTAVAATILGTLVAVALRAAGPRLGGAIFTFFLAPMIVPRIIIAVALFGLFAQMGLVATNLGLAIGHTVLALPFAVIAVTATLKTYDDRLDQAAWILGANRLRTFLHVTIPLIKGGLIAAFLFAFVTSFDELTVALFVSGGITTTLPKQMWDDMILQLNPTLAAVSVVILAVVTTLLIVAERLRRANPVR
jgi:ABC-type spermidine/putrescine transport system permease subunit I